MDLDVTKMTGYMPISRPLAIEYGLVDPTPEERAQLEREAAESRRGAYERDLRLAVARARLADLTDPLVRAILGLHAESGHGECTACIDGDFADDWPCDTVELVARHYGIETP